MKVLSNIKEFNIHQQLQEQLLKDTDFSKNFNNKTEIDPSIYLHPTLAEYYLNFTPFVTLSIFVAVLIVVLNLSIFCTTVAHLRRNAVADHRGLSILLCSLYPLISCAALTTLLLPKTWLVCHTVMHLSFTVGAVAFQALCFRYVDSEANYLKNADANAVNIITPPCCCCCMCLPALVPTKGKLCLLRYMVLQMPFVQSCIMLILNVIYIRDQTLYRNATIYFIPFIVCSILIGLWGLNITVRIINAVHSDLNLMKRVFCLQLIMLLCKVQYMLLDSQLNHLVLGGKYPINHTIYKQTIINLLIICEMVLVSMLVQNAYKEIPAKREADTAAVKSECDINKLQFEINNAF